MSRPDDYDTQRVLDEIRGTKSEGRAGEDWRGPIAVANLGP